jgi:ubiquitin carboxyl-terminal hydrolase 16/45
MRKTPPMGEEAEGSPRKKAPRLDDAARTTVPVASAPSPTRKTPPEGEETEGNPRNKSPRPDDAARTTVPVASAPSPTRKTPPNGEEAEGSPRKKSPRLDDAARTTVSVASAPSPTRKTPPNGEETEGSPRKKSPRPAEALPVATVPVEAAVGASDEKLCKCNHAITDSDIWELVHSLTTKDAWICCACRRKDEKRDLLICVGCYSHLCCGVGSIAYPFGHSRSHALKKKHWFAVLYSDPERGYCFKCNAEVPMLRKCGEDGNEGGLELIRDIVSQLPDQPSVGKLSSDMALLLESPVSFLNSSVTS